MSAPVPVPFLWTLAFWIWDLDLGPGFGTWIENLDSGKDSLKKKWEFSHSEEGPPLQKVGKNTFFLFDTGTAR